MKKILMFLVLSLFLASNLCAATGWVKTKPAGSLNPGQIDDAVGENNAAIDLMLANYQNCRLTYDTAAQVTVSVGGVMVSSASGATRLMVLNSSATTVTWADIDTGAEEASTTYYVYAIVSATTDTTFTCKISKSATEPAGATYYKQLGSFYNDASSNITNVYDENAITKYMLKTVLGEVSATLNHNSSSATLPGGEYGFYPQIKASTGAGYWSIGGTITLGGDSVGSTYVTHISFSSDVANTLYAQQRYVTASGKDYWIFLLIDKATDEILSSYAAADHPAYGNGGDFAKITQPFGEYDSATQEVVLVEKDTAEALKAESEKTGKSILALINEDYKPKMSKKETYIPLHSGKFIGKQKELIAALPDYIAVRKLTKLIAKEKQDKQAARLALTAINDAKKAEEVLIQNEIKKEAIAKLEASGVVFKYQGK